MAAYIPAAMRTIPTMAIMIPVLVREFNVRLPVSLIS
jgi:hypothetical protein